MSEPGALKESFRVPLSPTERRLRAQIAVNESWSRTEDPAARTQPARDAFRKRFELQVDPEGVLPPKDRARRAEAARKAYFARLAFQSAQARRLRKAGTPAARTGGAVGHQRTTAPTEEQS